MPDDKLVLAFSDVNLSPSTILVILRQIGDCYGIAYSRLRPTDCFVRHLSKIDSWRFDSGAEGLEKWLRKEFGVAVPKDAATFTVLDLLRLVEEAS